nr:MAG TPA: Protein of unknown function (DUF2833) [Caudoviricetes sp.]
MLYAKTINKKDVTFVLDNLRDEDRKEMLEEFGSSWYKVLLSKCMCNNLYTIMNSFHQPVGLFGVKPHDDYAEVCLLCTDKLKDDAISFLLQAKKYISVWLNKYKRLENYVYKRKHSAISWLTWLGFTFKDFDNLKMYCYKELK